MTGKRIGVAIGLLVVAALVAFVVIDRPTGAVDRYSVIDGDTLEWTPGHCTLSDLGLGCFKHRLRLYGVDAFERKQNCRHADGSVWPCGTVATERLRALVAKPDFHCRIDYEFLDRRSREFAVCLVDGQDVGALLVSEGLAFAYGRGLQYFAVEAEAKRLGRGAWSGRFVRPQYFREGAVE